MPKKYIDSRGWKYQVMPGWKGLGAVRWRGSRVEAQTDLDRLAEKKGRVEWNG